MQRILTEPVVSLVTKMETASHKQNKAPPAVAAAPKPIGRQRGGARKRPDPPPRAPVPSHETLAANVAGAFQTSSQVQTVANQAKPRVCFDHDPANGKTCAKGQACLNEHLDTRQEANRKRFEHAMLSFDRANARRRAPNR